MKTKRFFLFISTVVLVLSGLGSYAYPQDKGYPGRTIQINVGSGAGGGVDTLCRILADELKNIWKVPVTVVNKTGGGGVVACSDVANAEKDGYTILGWTSTMLSSLSVANPKGPVNVFRDFEPLVILADYAPDVMVVHVDSPFKSLEDVINYARQKPGELVAAVSTVGSNTALEILSLNRSAKINITQMNLEGTAPIATNVLGKHVQLGMIGYIPARPHINAGKFRVLVSGSKSSFLKVPTFDEKGFPDVNVSTGIAVAGPKGLPPAVKKAWDEAIGAIQKNPDFTARLNKLGYEVNFVMGSAREEHFKKEMKRLSIFSTEELGWKK